MNLVERYSTRVLNFLVASPIGRNDVISGPLRVVLLVVYLTSRDLRVDPCNLLVLSRRLIFGSRLKNGIPRKADTVDINQALARVIENTNVLGQS